MKITENKIRKIERHEWNKIFNLAKYDIYYIVFDKFVY